MVRHGLKHIFQKPTPDIDSSDRTQQLRSKTIYCGTVNLAETLASGNNRVYKTYNGPYKVENQAGVSKLTASHTYEDLLSITKGKVLLTQPPLTPSTDEYYQKNFARGQMYEGNYNRFDPMINVSNDCNDSVMVYDIGVTGFTGPASYNANGGFIGATGPQSKEGVAFGGYLGTTVAVATGNEENNNRIFIDPNHCYYSNPCLQDASYTRFVTPNLTGLTGNAQFNAQQIINSDQYRCFNYPMPNIVLARQLLPPIIEEIFNGVPQAVVITNIEFPNNESTVPDIVDVEPRTPF